MFFSFEKIITIYYNLFVSTVCYYVKCEKADLVFNDSIIDKNCSAFLWQNWNNEKAFRDLGSGLVDLFNLKLSMYFIGSFIVDNLQ